MSNGPSDRGPLGFVTINCVDRGRSAEFYSDVLGGVVDPHQDFNLGGFVYRFGSLRVVLMHNAETQAADQFPRNAMVLLSIEVPDLQETYQRVIASEGKVIQPPNDGFSMLLSDPDGITIEVFRS